MWTFDKDFGKWLSKDDKLSKDSFDIYRQELSSYRFYSKCLSGATYLPINNLENIYDIISKYTPRNWYISPQGSQYVNTNIPIESPTAITIDNSDEYYTKYLSEYGLTLKNKFTADRLIKDSINNFLTVDVATVQFIDLFNLPDTIDSVRLIEGHRVLVKNQTTNIVLSNLTDPNTVFEGNFQIVENFGSTTEYEFFSEDNGIYLFTNNQLVKQTDLDDYIKSIRYSVSVKLGDVNRDRQFHLSRLKTGYYPSPGQPVEFIENKNWLLRNQVDYNNLFDLNFYDVIKHESQTYNYEGFTYSIPERTLTVGEFGTIINNQDGVSNIINNKYKVNLRSIDQTTSYYWIVGDRGILLKVRKHDFDIDKIDINISTNLKSISFFNDLNGVAVGELNTILVTNNGGVSWERIKIDAFDSYYFNKVIYVKSNRFFIAGDNGIFIEFRRDISGWTAYRRRVSRFEDSEDDYLLVDNINDLVYVETNNWNLDYTYSTQSTASDKELIVMVTNDSKVILHDINNSIPFDTQFFYLKFDQEFGDIVNISRRAQTNDLFFTTTGNDGNSEIYRFNLNNFNKIGIGNPVSNVIIQSNIKKFLVSVISNPDGPGAIYQINGENKPVIELVRGFVYIFDQSDSTNTNHPIAFRDTSENSFTLGVVSTGTPGQSGAQTAFEIANDAPDNLKYYCTVHGNNMGNTISIVSVYNVVSDIFTNRLFDYDGQELIIAGNNSIFRSSNYTQLLQFTDLDPNFDSRLKSKMLFLDYDIASKLNFFTDEGDYRLPESTSFTYSNTNISFEPITIGTQSEVNWFNYWQDRQMTFEYHNNQGIDDSKKVLISSTFSYQSFSFNQTFIGLTNSLSGINNLAPNISDIESSRFYGTQSISEPINNSYNLYLYDYLMVYKVNSLYPVDIGDVIRLESDLIDSNFIVNKILTFGSNKYIYMFTEFNQNIITNLVNENIKISNLNKFDNLLDFIDKFNNHPISIGYSLDINNNDISVSAKFNNLTSYYNMATNVKVNGINHDMVYLNSFLKFGYTPTYNILDYLSKIDSNFFTETKQYLVMPDYRNMPMTGSGNLSSDNIYMDYNNNSNKLIIGENLKFEWESLFINTFVDVIVYDSQSQTHVNDKLLITKKYKIDNYDNLGFDAYVVEFHKVIRTGTSPLISIDIISRRTLKQISDDLQELNNIQRPLNEKSYNVSQSLIASFKTYEKMLNFRINTDSYAKILLSDLETLEAITALIYIDDKNELSMNITRVDNERVVRILNTGNQNGKLLIICDGPHDLVDGDGVILEFIGGVGSSQELNPQYFGFRTIEVVNDNNFSVDVDFGVSVVVGNDTGFVKFIKKDPFLNYQPVDITDIGTDKRGTRAIELNPDNTELVQNIVSLVDVDFNKFRFRLIDGLNIETLALNYSWVYEAEISDAVIGLTDNQLTWYKGTWECGRWFGGRWLSGTWISGDWYGGTWESKLIKDNWINVEVDDKSSNLTSSVWFGGRWFDGTWDNGTWVDGRWYSGEWNNGRWFNGIWNDGVWNAGRFTGGIWVLGTWNSGFFNTENGPSYWLDGTWNSGDFENGMWYNGTFDEKNGESRFGVRSYNSRTSTWHAGNWISGSFHSRLNVDSEGQYDVSNIHKYSIWRTGNWFSGDWYGGICFNIDFKSGVWYGGILEDIQVIGFNQTSNAQNNEIVLNGIFKFNTGDSITIIDNNNGTLTNIGSNQSPGRYTVLYYVEDPLLKKTRVYVDSNISLLTVPVNDTDTGLKVVSQFRNCNWKSGIWNNGIYEAGLWEGGIWYDGIFTATWM